jgi:hypothetical protein
MARASVSPLVVVVGTSMAGISEVAITTSTAFRSRFCDEAGPILQSTPGSVCCGDWVPGLVVVQPFFAAGRYVNYQIIGI